MGELRPRIVKWLSGLLDMIRNLRLHGKGKHLEHGPWSPQLSRFLQQLRLCVVCRRFVERVPRVWSVRVSLWDYDL